MKLSKTLGIVAWTAGSAAVTGGLFLWSAHVFWFYLFVASPLLLGLLLVLQRGSIVAHETRTPALRLSRSALEDLTAGWDRTSGVLALLAEDWEWRPIDLGRIDAIAAPLHPLVARDPARGGWRLQEKEIMRIDSLRIVEAQIAWDALRVELLQAATVELGKQVEWAEILLARLRGQHLVTASRITPPGEPKDWPGAMRAIDRLRDDLHLALNEAMAGLGADAAAVALQGQIQAHLKAGRLRAAAGSICT